MLKLYKSQCKGYTEEKIKEWEGPVCTRTQIVRRPPR